MSLYVKLFTGFYTHRKTLALRAKLGDDALWIPPRLWAYAATNQPDGDFSGYTSEMLGMLLECPKHASSIREALVDTGFIDADGRLHNWDEHNGFHREYAERARKAAQARWKPGEDGKKKNKKKEDIDNERASLKHGPSMLEAFRVRVGSWFNRKPESKWMPKELKILEFVHGLNTSEEDLTTLESYYLSGFPYLRKDPGTLLNNWQCEIDRAMGWAKSSPPTSSTSQPGRPLNSSERIALKAGVRV